MSDLIYGAPLWLVATNFWAIRSSTSSKECVLVDVPPDPGAVIDFLTQRCLKVVAIIATHGHIDHVGGIPTLVEAQENLGADNRQTIGVHLHHGDHYRIQDPISNSAMLGAELAKAHLSTKVPELLLDIADGQKIRGAGMEFEALHTPGHTQGSMCFKLRLADLDPMLFSGDHLFAGSIGRTDLEGGSIDDLINSMKEKILPLAENTIVLPGHGDTTTIGKEKASNPFLRDLF